MNYPYDELGSGIDRIFVQTLNKNFDEVEEDIQNLYNPVKSIIEGAFDDAALVANFESLLRDEVDRLEPSIQEFKTETDNKFAGVTAQLAQKAQQSDLEIERARISNLTTNAGNTDGNAELIDIRVGFDGITYPTAGEATRALTNYMYTEGQEWSEG